MTGMINMDKLLQSFETDSPEKVRFSETMIRNIIELQPTVEAIPVEWIRKYTEENRLYQSDDFDLYISDMIADWAERKEK